MAKLIWEISRHENVVEEIINGDLQDALDDIRAFFKQGFAEFMINGEYEVIPIHRVRLVRIKLGGK